MIDVEKIDLISTYVTMLKLQGEKVSEDGIVEKGYYCFSSRIGEISYVYIRKDNFDVMFNVMNRKNKDYDSNELLISIINSFDLVKKIEREQDSYVTYQFSGEMKEMLKLLFYIEKIIRGE